MTIRYEDGTEQMAKIDVMFVHTKELKEELEVTEKTRLRLFDSILVQAVS